MKRRARSQPVEVQPDLPWPFADGRFPADLGAVIQRTVLDGTMPARNVLHSEDNHWLVGDGVNDPNVSDGCVVAHMSHVVQSNSSVDALADLPPGFEAVRNDPGQPWLRRRLVWLEEDEEFA